MESNSSTLTITPPRLVPSIAAGFNTVANRLSLLLLPAALDLFLWFGPKLRVHELLLPALQRILDESLLAANAPETTTLIKSTQEVWQVILERFNLLTLLRTYPIGVPSLLFNQGELKTPFGDPPLYEMTSLLGLIALWLGIILAGIFAGCVFFNAVARATSELKAPFYTRLLLRQYVQILIFSATLVFVAVLLFIPVSLMLFLVIMISPAMAEVILFFMGLLVLWLVLPLIFTPHGIFAYNQNLVTTSMTSMRLVRLFLPSAGLFLIILLLIGQGLDVIWRIPPETSWMQIIGVLGHAFVSTSLISASFIYYRGGIAWMQETLRQRAEAQKVPQKMA